MTSNYPSFPEYSSSNPDPVAPVRPKPVDTSFMLWIANAALGLLGFLITVSVGREATRTQIIDQLRAQGETFTESQVDSLVTAGIIFAGVIAAVFFGLYLLFAFKMRAGRNWARITLAVLGGLGLIFGLIGLAQGTGGAVSMILSVLQIALIAGAIYFMYTKEASAYFDAAKRRP
ncbi:hypothetical protein [Actinokineospora xionganensis]|uniref:DUF2127 domain-containing protein n=1 Tax=Actinokineospora xionganensis TaxID=2684470 RepID=A0ABR7L1D9_9PSEU|nr:hypothetical protein [Actinokineospora xionganensis]MBC6446495.1 hypothetical protein [Actinokineospora xionganensis]